MKFKFLHAAVAGLIMLASSTANAGLISFDLTSGDQSDSLDFFSEGYTLSVVGRIWDGDNYVVADVIANGNGLGVVGGGEANRLGGILDNDETYPQKGDYLLFTFSSLFKSVGIDFADSNNVVKFNLDERAYVKTMLNGSKVDKYGFSGDGSNTWESGMGGWANQISVKVKTSDGSDGFKLDRLTVDVPEPSTLAIFALGIMGLVSRRFKKQS